MSIIVPAILEEDPEIFADKLAEVLKIPNVTKIQVDFSDGIFTPHKTISVGDVDVLNPAYTWEAHLMVKRPEDYFFDLKIAGFSSVIISYEAARDAAELKTNAMDLANMKISAGLAVNPETPLEQLSAFEGLFEQIQLMGVHPGSQGQPIAPEIFEKVEKLKKQLKNVKIGVDGGIKLSNVRKLAFSGVDYLVVGSGLFQLQPGEDKDPAVPIAVQNFEKYETEIKNL